MTDTEIIEAAAEQAGVDVNRVEPIHLYEFQAANPDIGAAEAAESLAEFREDYNEVATASHLTDLEDELSEADKAHAIHRQVVTDGQIGREPDGPRATEVQTVVPTGRASGKLLEECSGKRYCQLSQLEYETGIDARPIRLEVPLPPPGNPIREGVDWRTPAIEQAASLVPHPDAADQLERQGQLASTQRGLAWSRARSFMEHFDLLPVDAEPESSLVGPVNSWTITAMDADLVRQFAKAGREELHYLSNLLSGGGYWPGTDEADQRKVRYEAMEPQVMSEVTNLLGLGPTTSDLDIRELIIDGHSPLILPAWPDDNHWLKDTQFRAVTGHKNLEPGKADGDLSLSKGCWRPIHPRWTRAALDSGDGTERARQIISRAMKAHRPTLILAKGDQVKVGAGRMADRGTALATATFLTGTLGEEGELPPRQFEEINKGPQFAQFLKPEGFKRLVGLVKMRAETLAEKCRSVEGIASLVSEKLAEDREDILAGVAQYQTGGNLLEDAIRSGAVIEQTRGKVEQAEGKSPSPGNVATLPAIANRLEGTIASRAEEFLERLGMYAIGTLNFTCLSSEKLMRRMWQCEETPENYFSGDSEVYSPLADPSGQVLPLKAILPLGADDDGDIALVWAADTKVGGLGTCKVVGVARYPNVDHPTFFALEEGTPTPFDAQGEEEKRLFKSMMHLYGLEEKEEEPSLDSDEITMLNPSLAYTLSERGAKDGVEKRKATGAMTRENAYELVETKTSLNQAGPRTRDLERFLHAANEAYICRSEAESEAEKRKWQSVLEEGLAKAEATSGKCEAVLTQFKYENDRDLSQEPVDGLEPLGYTGADEMATEQLPLDYHNEISVDRLIDQGRSGGNALETWDGPSGQARVAKLLRWLAQGPLQDVASAFEEIDQTVDPFLDMLEETAPEEPSEEVHREADYTLRLCDWWREFWTDFLDQQRVARAHAVKPEETEEALDERRRTASRQISNAMESLARPLSGEALALALLEDWEPTRSYNPNTEEFERRVPSQSAGLAMIAGRMGEVFQTGLDIERIQPRERYCLVYRSGEDLPVEAPGEPAVIGDLAIQPGRRALVADVGGELIELMLDSQAELPPEEVTCERYEVRLSKLDDRMGMVRWVQA